MDMAKLNKNRDEMIAGVRQAEKEAFDHYESIREKLKLDEKLKSLEGDEKVAYLESKLFAKKSVVFLTRSRHDSRIFLAVFEFYLTQFQTNFLK